MTWLIGAADSSKQVATTRAKAIKALGLVAEQDPRLLVLEVVRDGVYRALQVGNADTPVLLRLEHLVNCASNKVTKCRCAYVTVSLRRHVQTMVYIAMRHIA